MCGAYTGGFGHVLESAVASVAIEPIGDSSGRHLRLGDAHRCSEIDQEEIGESVTVVVPPGDARSHVLRKLAGASEREVLETDACLLGDFRESDVRGRPLETAIETSGDTLLFLTGYVRGVLLLPLQEEEGCD